MAIGHWVDNNMDTSKVKDAAAPGWGILVQQDSNDLRKLQVKDVLLMTHKRSHDHTRFHCLNRNARWNLSHFKELIDSVDRPLFSVDVDLHGSFSTDWIKQKVVYAKSRSKYSIFVIRLVAYTIFREFVSFRNHDFWHHWGWFLNKNKKVDKMFTPSECSKYIVFWD